MKLSGLALLGAASVAAAQNHAHQHRHPARHGSPVERDAAAVTATVPGPVVTVFELNGEDISWDEVQDGLKNGKYVIVGDIISTVIPAPPSTTAIPSTSSTPTPTPTPTPTTTPTPSSSASAVAEFFESKQSFSSSTAWTSTYQAPTTSSTSEAAKTSSAAPIATSSGSSGSSSSSGSGLDTDFPSGTLDCDTFPSDYGAMAVDWLNLNGWISVQQVSGYTPSVSSISDIVAALTGGCTKNSFCSYACPAGYQKSQWPTAQGSSGQSIGGLYCNSDGKLELSRTEETKLCTAGAGGVQVINNLGSNVAVCRTNYPGDEAETVPMDVAAGATEEVCNPNANTYYQWEGAPTSAQYYINPSGFGAHLACIWGSAGTDLGNWAPVNLGVGQSSSGTTFLSLFPNAPTNPNGVLDFNIKITGDVSGECSYSGGKYYSNGVESSTGCTESVTNGGTAKITFSSS